MIVHKTKESGMKRYSILLLSTLLVGSLVHSGVGSCGAQVPVGTGTTGSVTLSSDCTELAASDFSGVTGYTISSAGKYCLTESFTDSDATTAIISIAADDVTLDFKGHSIDGGGTSVGISISGTRHNITIKNGTLRDVITTGIAVPDAITELTIEDFTINNCSGDAIEFAGTSFTTRLENVTITSDDTATGKGIEVIGAAQNFVLDKFSIDNLSGSGMHAIEFTAGSHGILIKNGRITDIGTGTSTDAINFGAASHNIEISDVHISNITGSGISISATSHGIDIKDCHLTLCQSDGMNFGDNCHRVFIHDFTISAHTTDGIRFGTGAHNIEIKRGAISSSNSLGEGIEFGVGAYKVAMEKLSIERGLAGILVALSADSIVIKNSSVSNFFSSNANYGIKFEGGTNIGLEDVSSTNCNEQSSESNHAGIWFVNCSAVGCLNVYSSGHTGDEAYGFKLDTVTSGYFENCFALKNTSNATGSPTADVPEAGIGFYIKDSTGCRFFNCKTADNVSPRYVYGFYLTGSSGNLFENCTSLRNRATTQNALATSAGFYSIDGVGNTWNNCLSNGNIVNSTSTTSTDGYGAFGFYFGNEQQSTLFQCKAKSNGLVSAHFANATGIFLDGTITTDCKYCQIRDCETSANCTSATSGLSAFGIRDSATDTTNIIISCMSFGNKDAASPVLTTNYWMDLPIGGDTKSNWPVTTGTMDSLIEFANLPNLYNIDIE